ncbi:excinuclease ABC subunit A [Mameliella sp.]|uniref:excinuclease ABC subunit A n=1 Tax=Mameliella sp. TaxID=1924940 RepID=UPI003B510BF9
MQTRSLAILILAAMPLALPATAQPKGCPPGLAKKDPACVPPGLAKKRVQAPDRHYITDDYVILGDPLRYGLDPDRTYYRLGDEVVRVDRETSEILNFIGSLAALLD